MSQLDQFPVRGSILGTVLLANDLQKLEKSALKTQMTIFLATLAGWLNRKQHDVIKYLNAVPRSNATTAQRKQTRYSKNSWTRRA